MDRGGFPRELNPSELELLLWLLPLEKPGYAEYRDLIHQWKVVAQGRRGRGNFILAPLDERPDNESPLPSVLAYGIVETDHGEVSVTVRERLGNQIEFEIAALGRSENLEITGERRRWTFSTWSPGHPCPKCGMPLRDIPMVTESQRHLVLALCGTDERLWIADDATGVNHPIPVTNFYNELMLHKRVRDPRVAFDPKRLFRDLDKFTDDDLIRSFRAYNKVRMKVFLESEILTPPQGRASLFGRILSFLAKRV